MMHHSIKIPDLQHYMDSTWCHPSGIDLVSIQCSQVDLESLMYMVFLTTNSVMTDFATILQTNAHRERLG